MSSSTSSPRHPLFTTTSCRASAAPPAALPDFSRSEAFAEDLSEHLPEYGAGTAEGRRPSRWLGLLNLLPLLVALAGVAFALVPAT